MSAADAIKKLRVALCVNKSELATMIGVDRSAISNYESGNRFPRASVIRKLVEVAKKHKVKITYDDFFDQN